MCGICGIYSNTPDKTPVIKRMMHTLEHRGNDDRGLWEGSGCALGHQRLSILDLSPNGRQPMGNEDGTVKAVINGEIYNYKSLQVTLRQKGHVFRSESDSEVVIHAYEEYGLPFITKLQGMFALALYDIKTETLVLARDPTGIKPLYYQSDGRDLVFASEIKALFEAGAERRVNYNAIPAYLMYQYIPGDETLFAGIYKLRAGHILVATPCDMKISRYWQISDNGAESISDNPAGNLRRMLEESVKLRLQSDVPVGAFLSGGVDSSAVTALYRKFYPGELHTFTATFDNFSESKYAKQVSKHLETTYHEVRITPKMVARDIERMAWHYDEPISDGAVMCNYYLAREAKRYVTVVLAGEGGDEVFGGYPWQQYTRYILALHGLSPIVRGLGRYLLHTTGADSLASKLYPLGRLGMATCQTSRLNALLYPTTATSDMTVRWLLNGDALPIQAHFNVASDIRQLSNKALALDYLNLLPEKYLMKADKATMAWAIEERVPLLDQEVVKLAFKVNPNLKRNKWVLRKAVEDLLPPEIVWRKKQGFGVPVGMWLQSPEMRGMVRENLEGGRLLREICRPEAIRDAVKVLDKDCNVKQTVAQPMTTIWTLFALQLWYGVWFGG